MALYEIKVPQLGVNDTEAQLIEKYIFDGDFVIADKEIGLLETSKAIFSVDSIDPGFLRWLVDEGDTVLVNQVIAIVATTDKELGTYVYDSQLDTYKYHDDPKVPPIITNKALKLAEKLGVDWTLLGITGRPITTDDIKNSVDSAVTLLELGFFIYGAGKGGVEIAASLYDRPIGFIDEMMAGSALARSLGNPIITETHFLSLFENAPHKPEVFVAIANGKTRLSRIKKLRELGFFVTSIGTPEIYGDRGNSRLSLGTHYKKGCVLGNNVTIGTGCILDYNTTISHDTRLGDAVHIAPGATIGSSVTIGDFSIIGINAAVATNIKIGKNCIITPGTSVTTDVEDNCVVEGVPGVIIGQRK